MISAPLFLGAALLVLLASSLWIGFALMGAGVAALAWFRDLPIERVLALWRADAYEYRMTLERGPRGIAAWATQ